MSGLPRCSSVQLPRPKYYLDHLGCLIDFPPLQQPETEVNKKLFPNQSYSKKLSISHQRSKSITQLRNRKFDLQFSPKKVPTGRSPTKQPFVEHEARRTLFRGSVGEGHQFQIVNGCVGTDESRHYNMTLSQPLPSKIRSQELQRGGEEVGRGQKKFLRKGSNIQKQIVVNLLRNKLIKEREERNHR